MRSDRDNSNLEGLHNDVFRNELGPREIVLLSSSIYLRLLPWVLILALMIILPSGLAETYEGSAYSFPVRLLESVVTFLIYIILIQLAWNHLTSRADNTMRVLKESLMKLPSACFTMLIQGIFLILALLLLVFPFFVSIIFWVFVMQAVVLKDLQGKNALKYSKAIVLGRWWQVFSYVTILFTIGFTIEFAISKLTGDPSQLLINAVFQIPGALLFSFSAILMTVLFINMEATLHFVQAEREMAKTIRQLRKASRKTERERHDKNG